MEPSDPSWQLGKAWIPLINAPHKTTVSCRVPCCEFLIQLKHRLVTFPCLTISGSTRSTPQGASGQVAQQSHLHVSSNTCAVAGRAGVVDFDKHHYPDTPVRVAIIALSLKESICAAPSGWPTYSDRGSIGPPPDLGIVLHFGALSLPLLSASSFHTHECLLHTIVRLMTMRP